MVMKMPPVTISLSGRVPGDCSRTPRDGFDDDGCGGTFLENWLGYLGFSRSGEYIGARATSVGTRGGPTMPRRGQGGPAPGGGEAAPVPVFGCPSVFVLSSDF